MDLLRERLRCRDQHRLPCSEAPDMTPVAEAAKASAEVGREALQFYRDQWNEGAPDRAAATKLAKEQAGIQNQLSADQLAYSREERARTRELFQPIEARVAADAMDYDSPARKEAAAAAASADVQTQIDAQRGQTMRAMERSGALPTSGRVAAMQGMLDIGAAKAKAGAANTARREVETLGAAKRMDAIGVGKGVVGNQATTASLGMSAGNSAVGNAQAPINIAAAGAGLMGQGFQANLQAQGQAGKLYGDVANAQLQADANNAAVWQGLGQLGGAAITKFSDRNMKTDIAALDDDDALDAVLKTPAYTYTYKEGSEADDGGQMHAGAMAQDMEQTMGAEVSDGRKVNVLAEQGVILAATKALDKKINRVAAAVGMQL